MERLQTDLNKLQGWSDKWLLEFSLCKYKIMKIGERTRRLEKEVRSKGCRPRSKKTWESA